MVLVEANLVTTALMQVGKRLVPRRRPYAEFCEPTPRTNLCTVDATADVPEIPGVIAYGATQLKAFAKVRKLALEVIADRLDRERTSSQAARRSQRRSRRSDSRSPLAGSRWRASKARRVLAALLRIGWSAKRQRGSHRVLQRYG